MSDSVTLPVSEYGRLTDALEENGRLKEQLQIRSILQRNTVCIPTFCALVARVYGSTSHRIHCSTRRINLADLIEGLKMYGLDDQRLLYCVVILNEMKHLRLSSPPLSVVTTPVSSRSATPVRTSFRQPQQRPSQQYQRIHQQSWQTHSQQSQQSHFAFHPYNRNRPHS